MAAYLRHKCISLRIVLIWAHPLQRGTIYFGLEVSFALRVCQLGKIRRSIETKMVNGVEDIGVCTMKMKWDTGILATLSKWSPAFLSEGQQLLLSRYARPFVHGRG